MSDPYPSTISPESKTRSVLNLAIQLNSAIHVTAEAGALVKSDITDADASVKLRAFAKTVGGTATVEAPTSLMLQAAKLIKDGAVIRIAHTSETPPTTSVFKRHDKQLGKDIQNPGLIAKLNNLPDLIINATEYCAGYKVPEEVQKYRSLNDEPIFRPYLYLFNMLIAFEWQPSARTIQRIQLAAKKASDFLYDVTDGFMAIGQVIIGGPDLLDVADIQVMASNRFHPRSWINALREPHKFLPIRLGRGLWRKDQDFVVPWDESDSYRVLVHEWGHYALGLVDEYLDLVHIERNCSTDLTWKSEVLKEPISDEQKNVIVHGAQATNLHIIAPSIALPIDTIMSTLASSELLPRHGPRGDKQRAYMQKKLQDHFPGVALAKPLEGPAELPLPELPLFRRSDPNATEEEVELSKDHLKQLRDLLIRHQNLKIPSSSWVYVLKSGVKNVKDQYRIVGQGVLSERDWDEGFRLLGAVEGDQVVVVAQIINTETHAAWVEVVQGSLSKVELEKEIITQEGQRNVRPAKVEIGWKRVTPKVLPDFIDVLPTEPRSVTESDQHQLPTEVRVQIEARDLPKEVWVSALGQEPKPLTFGSSALVASDVVYANGSARMRWISDAVCVQALDGHVLLRWCDGSMYICGYSHGGGPCTGGGGRCVCYTAGSYEGNSMLFYRDNYDASDQEDPKIGDGEIGDQGTRIVSTVMQGGEQYLTLPTGNLAEARSYIFSLGSNQELNTHSATLVLYYDSDARKSNGDLLIYRWVEDKGAHWQRLTTYAPENQSYLCLPLDKATSETSGGKNEKGYERFDRYRIYWTPRP